MVESLLLKLLCFVFGCIAFTALAFMMNALVEEHSDKTEHLLRPPTNGGHGSPYRALARKLSFTWIYV